MNNELIEVIRLALKEEIDPVNKRLDGIEKNFDSLTQELNENKNTLTKEITDIKDTLTVEINGNINTFTNEIKDIKNTFTNEIKDNRNTLTKEISENKNTLLKEINELKIGQERLQKNIIVSLGQYTEKIADHVDNKTDALNKRVFAIETEIQRLIKQ